MPIKRVLAILLITNLTKSDWSSVISNSKSGNSFSKFSISDLTLFTTSTVLASCCFKIFIAVVSSPSTRNLLLISA